MGAHLIDGEFQSDKYPTCPAGKVPLSVKDATAQDLLWEYAQRRRSVDSEFSEDLQTALKAKGYEPGNEGPNERIRAALVDRIEVQYSWDCACGPVPDPECSCVTARARAEKYVERIASGKVRR